MKSQPVERDVGAGHRRVHELRKREAQRDLESSFDSNAESEACGSTARRPPRRPVIKPGRQWPLLSTIVLSSGAVVKRDKRPRAVGQATMAVKSTVGGQLLNVARGAAISGVSTGLPTGKPRQGLRRQQARSQAAKKRGSSHFLMSGLAMSVSLRGFSGGCSGTPAAARPAPYHRATLPGRCRAPELCDTMNPPTAPGLAEEPMFVVCGGIHVVAEQVCSLYRRHAGKNARGTRQEPGNVRFDVLSGSTICRFTLYEAYRDEAGFKAHQQTAHHLLTWRPPWRR